MKKQHKYLQKEEISPLFQSVSSYHENPNIYLYKMINSTFYTYTLEEDWIF